ncbi:tRNA nucleotidyltransferase, putative [Plasmodium ovale curtisi]|uniref:tRNA nucleotidyltransferase, putative n=1 Tax=Plasmodium ovale curtisi TaxID=864141 RepID=A0A1A8WDF4_PLAOA|nr:tRNA nucleotidyltransferase, putative [Plasmodium ovale curtisi]
MNCRSVFIFYFHVVITAVVSIVEKRAGTLPRKKYNLVRVLSKWKGNGRMIKKRKILSCANNLIYISSKRPSYHKVQLKGKHTGAQARGGNAIGSCTDGNFSGGYSDSCSDSSTNSGCSRGSGTIMHEGAYLAYLKNYVADGDKLISAQRQRYPSEETSEKPGEEGDNLEDEGCQIDTLIGKTIRKEEEDLFDFLINVNERYHLNCTLRVVGGWVRDKFLGLSNDDIDITVDNMKGADFCNYIREYIKEKENKNFNFGIIKINSDQSKHLETSSFNLFNFQVDIVNLRNEKYSEDSRIPEIVIGTPEEDALRRDFTVNALFYNLKNRKVEDYTKRGIFHLKNKIICTPLNPLATFLDDPLRIIRCIRFCGFFNFHLEKSIFNVLKNDDIKKSFNKKISKSRLSSEIIKIFSEKCKNVILALTLLNYSSYGREIFKLPPDYFIQNEEIFEKIRKSDKINKTLHSFNENSNTSTNSYKKIHLDSVIDEGDAIENHVHNGEIEKKKNIFNPNETHFLEQHEEKKSRDKGGDAESVSASDTGDEDNVCNSVMGRKEDKVKVKERDDWLFQGLNYVRFFKDAEKNDLLRDTFFSLDYRENINFIQICLFLLPLKNYFLYLKKSTKTEYVAEYIIRESLKFPLKYSKFCVNIYECFHHLYDLYKNIDVLNFLKNGKDKNNVHIKGDIVLFLKSVGEKWDLLLLIFYIFHKYNEVNKKYVTSITNDIYLSDFAKKLYQYILKNNLRNAHNIRPFLKWPDIKHNFPNITPNRISEVYEQIVSKLSATRNLFCAATNIHIRFTCIHGENEKDCIEFLKRHFNE